MTSKPRVSGERTPRSNKRTSSNGSKRKKARELSKDAEDDETRGYRRRRGVAPLPLDEEEEDRQLQEALKASLAAEAKANKAKVKAGGGATSETSSNSESESESGSRGSSGSSSTDDSSDSSSESEHEAERPPLEEKSAESKPTPPIATKSEVKSDVPGGKKHQLAASSAAVAKSKSTNSSSSLPSSPAPSSPAPSPSTSSLQTKTGKGSTTPTAPPKASDKAKVSAVATTPAVATPAAAKSSSVTTSSTKPSTAGPPPPLFAPNKKNNNLQKAPPSKTLPQQKKPASSKLAARPSPSKKSAASDDSSIDHKDAKDSKVASVSTDKESKAVEIKNNSDGKDKVTDGSKEKVTDGTKEKAEGGKEKAADGKEKLADSTKEKAIDSKDTSKDKTPDCKAAMVPQMVKTEMCPETSTLSAPPSDDDDASTTTAKTTTTVSIPHYADARTPADAEPLSASEPPPQDPIVMAEPITVSTTTLPPSSIPVATSMQHARAGTSSVGVKRVRTGDDNGDFESQPIKYSRKRVKDEPIGPVPAPAIPPSPSISPASDPAPAEAIPLPDALDQEGCLPQQDELGISLDEEEDSTTMQTDKDDEERTAVGDDSENNTITGSTSTVKTEETVTNEACKPSDMGTSGEAPTSVCDGEDDRQNRSTRRRSRPVSPATVDGGVEQGVSAAESATTDMEVDHDGETTISNGVTTDFVTTDSITPFDDGHQTLPENGINFTATALPPAIGKKHPKNGTNPPHDPSRSPEENAWLYFVYTIWQKPFMRKALAECVSQRNRAVDV